MCLSGRPPGQDRRRERQAIPGEGRERVPADVPDEEPDREIADDRRRHHPGREQRPFARGGSPASRTASPSLTAAPRIAGMPSRNTNRAAVVPPQTERHGRRDRRARARDAGHEGRRLRAADHDRVARCVSDSCRRRFAPNRSTAKNTSATSASIAGGDAGRAQPGLDVLRAAARRRPREWSRSRSAAPSTPQGPAPARRACRCAGSPESWRGCPDRK